MTTLVPPPIVFQTTRWSSEQLTAMARHWRASLAPTFEGSSAPVAMVVTNLPESVAAFFALSSFDAPVVLLPLDLKPWLTSPSIPPGTRLVLLPGQRDLAVDARAARMDALVLPAVAPSSAPSESEPPFMTMPGVVLFTSGSTGKPRAVYRSRGALLGVARALVGAMGLERGDGVITSLPLARAYGLNHGLMAATLTGGPLALLDRFDHHALLRLFASGEYRYWSCTPMMADVLSRCPLSADRHPAPELCMVGGVVPGETARRFSARFGVSLRQIYGTTETGSICVDAGPASDVRSDSSGRPLSGVAIRIGDDPLDPVPLGAAGRIWLSAPAYLMDGYGFPPAVAPADTVDGWWGSPDVGTVDADGFLTVTGRLDDTFRNSAGQLVNSASVAAALDGYPGIAEAVVVPLAGPSGPLLGVLVESAAPLAIGPLRRHLNELLPPWSQPRVIETTAALPRLANGRIDRRACIALLQEADR